MVDPIAGALRIAKRPHVGSIVSPVAGRTDHVMIDVPDGCFVVPADVVSALGEGNSLAGMRVLEKTFGPSEKHTGGKTVPIAAAGGEFVIGPHGVGLAGRGDMKKGFEALRKFVLGVRSKHIATLKKLPGPHR